MELTISVKSSIRSDARSAPNFLLSATNLPNPKNIGTERKIIPFPIKDGQPITWYPTATETKNTTNGTKAHAIA